MHKNHKTFQPVLVYTSETILTRHGKYIEIDLSVKCHSRTSIKVSLF